MKLKVNVILLGSATTVELQVSSMLQNKYSEPYRPSRISIVMARETTSRDAKSLATGA